MNESGLQEGDDASRQIFAEQQLHLRRHGVKIVFAVSCKG